MSDGIDGQSRTSRYGLWPEINGPASSTGQSVWETLRNVRCCYGNCNRLKGLQGVYENVDISLLKGDRTLENSPEVK